MIKNQEKIIKKENLAKMEALRLALNRKIRDMREFGQVIVTMKKLFQFEKDKKMIGGIYSNLHNTIFSMQRFVYRLQGFQDKDLLTKKI